jgi:PTS system glucose-specific IIC component
VALACLGIHVTDSVTVNETALQSAGVQGMMRGQDNVLHLVVGLNAEQYAGEITQRLGTKV